MFIFILNVAIIAFSILCYRCYPSKELGLALQLFAGQYEGDLKPVAWNKILLFDETELRTGNWSVTLRPMPFQPLASKSDLESLATVSHHVHRRIRRIYNIL